MANVFVLKDLIALIINVLNAQVVLNGMVNIVIVNKVMLLNGVSVFHILISLMEVALANKVEF